MTVTRCDICKKEVDRGDPCYRFTIKSLHHPFSLDDHLDLCGECHEEFLKWQVRMEERND